MTTLLQHSQALDSKLKSLMRAKRHANDHIYIQQRTQEWNNRNNDLKKLKPKTACLTLAIEDAKVVSSKRSTLCTNASAILARLQQNDDIKELTQDTAWKRLLKASEGLTEALEAAGSRAWRVYLEEQVPLERPAELRRRTPETPQNLDALRLYQASYTEYETIARLSLPRTAEDLVQLVAHITSCRQAFAQLTFDLPTEVKRFYEAINTGTATLAQVTPSVLEWFDEHGLLERFRVRSVG
ncbi:hypothetical protein FJY94_04505 [Candidatus Kaiserbacteria bacterium]|nr:hypothetical protein [Candidatus Kaiserbacteria bacterium]